MLQEKSHQIENVDAVNTRVNIVDLMKRAKIQKKKDKRNVLLITTAAISVLAVSGLFISN
jgi:ribosomal protein L19E